MKLLMASIGFLVLSSTGLAADFKTNVACRNKDGIVIQMSVSYVRTTDKGVLEAVVDHGNNNKMVITLDPKHGQCIISGR